MSKYLRIQFVASIALLAGFSLATWAARAAEPRDVASPAYEKVGMFNAIEQGQIEVSLTVKDNQQARFVARNLTDRPLTIEIPEAIAAVPILAQNQGGGLDGFNNLAPEFLNLRPEKFASRKTSFVCLEHGKPNPRSDMKYEVKPIETITTDARVVALVAGASDGRMSHAAAQAAAWHMQNGMSWKELAAKRREHLGGGSDPYFSAAQLQQASQLVAQLEKQFEQESQATPADEYTDGSLQLEEESTP